MGVLDLPLGVFGDQLVERLQARHRRRRHERHLPRLRRGAAGRPAVENTASNCVRSSSVSLARPAAKRSARSRHAAAERSASLSV
jgi:hypothetical protein